MKNKTKQILWRSKKVIIGKDDILRKVFMSILSGGHVLLEDVPGVGKPRLPSRFQRCLDWIINVFSLQATVFRPTSSDFLCDKQSGNFVHISPVRS